MTRKEIASELAGLSRLLREHAFLKYSESSRAEYEEKMRSTGALLAVLMTKASTVQLSNPYPLVSVDGLISIGPDSGQRVAKRIASRLSRLAKHAKDEAKAERLQAASEAWHKAARIVAALPL